MKPVETVESGVLDETLADRFRLKQRFSGNHKYNKVVHRELTVVEHVYFTSPEGPVGLTTTYCREVTTDEQPYYRTKKIGIEWEKLDTGWLSTCSCLLIKNDASKHTNAPELTISFNSGNSEDITVLPGESQRLSPKHLDKIYLRASSPDCKVNINITPV